MDLELLAYLCKPLLLLQVKYMMAVFFFVFALLLVQFSSLNTLTEEHADPSSAGSSCSTVSSTPLSRNCALPSSVGGWWGEGCCSWASVLQMKIRSLTVCQITALCEPWTAHLVCEDRLLESVCWCPHFNTPLHHASLWLEANAHVFSYHKIFPNLQPQSDTCRPCQDHSHHVKRPLSVSS